MGACWREGEVVLEMTLGEGCSRFGRVVHCHTDSCIGVEMCFAVDAKWVDNSVTVDTSVVEQGRSVRSGS